MRAVAEVEIEAVILGRECSISFTRITEATRENYGADADGRRGMMMWMLDSDDATEIKAAPNDTGIEAPIESLPGPIQVAIREAVEVWMRENDPEPDERGPEDEED